MTQETKRCPFCGQEILAVAKKCKYCRQWLPIQVKKATSSEEQAAGVNELEQKPIVTQETIINEPSENQGIETEPRESEDEDEDYYYPDSGGGVLDITAILIIVATVITILIAVATDS